MALDPTEAWSVDAYFTLLKKCRGVCYLQSISLKYMAGKKVADFIDTTKKPAGKFSDGNGRSSYLSFDIIPVDVGCCTVPKHWPCTICPITSMSHEHLPAAPSSKIRKSSSNMFEW
jgi:hypothetical protein